MRRRAAKSAVKTFAELLSACRLDRVMADFVEEDCPLEPVTPDEADWEVVEHHFRETVLGELALRRLAKMGYRLLGGSRRAMEFIAAHPDLQLDHPLVITTCWQQHDGDGDWVMPIASGGGGKRYLGIRWIYFKFTPDYGFLVLRRKNAKTAK